MDNTSSIKAILFLAFQINQKIHKDPVFQTFFTHFADKRPTPTHKCISNQGRVHPRYTKKREEQLLQHPCLCTIEKKVIHGPFTFLTQIISISYRKTSFYIWSKVITFPLIAFQCKKHTFDCTLVLYTLFIWKKKRVLAPWPCT